MSHVQNNSLVLLVLLERMYHLIDDEPLEDSGRLFLLEHDDVAPVFSVAEGHVMFFDTC